MHPRHQLKFTLLAALISLSIFVGCGSTGMMERDLTTLAGDSESAQQLIERSVAAHGGNLFADVSDLSVAYEGEWGFFAPKVQPLVADPKYRKTSQERYLFPDGVVLQKHEGPAGAKIVLRDRDSITVAYDDSVIDDEKREKASALVADVYVMLSTGPSFFVRDGVELMSSPPETLEGRAYDVAIARLRPGFGFSDEDRAKIWIDPETRLLHRVQFTLEGFPSTQGAEVDVIFTEHREIDGYVWPTSFVERIREPFDVFAHRWRLVGLDVNRGLTRADIELEWSEKAAEPARRLGMTDGAD